ncbi:MAG: hypothetical protein EPN88_10905 [Bacteroidetes bacterium]|nr:MAG: hypothetical protein EPN88_10905 [Bacteroidota bacterium]
MKRLNKINRMIRDSLWKINYFQFKLEIIPDNPNPSTLKKNIVYVVGGPNYEKWAYLKCPCGCNDIIMLSLDNKQRPSWTIKQDKKGRVTISPSIRKLDGCKSHFMIKKGRLLWSKD